MGYKELGYSSYYDYLQDDHFRALTVKYIYTDSSAKCFIDGKKYPEVFLLLHHVSYDNLGRETLGRDVFILCYNCHKKAHFIKMFLLFEKRIPLTNKKLKKRLYYLKVANCIRKLQFIRASWYILTYSMT